MGAVVDRIDKSGDGVVVVLPLKTYKLAAFPLFVTIDSGHRNLGLESSHSKAIGASWASEYRFVTATIQITEWGLWAVFHLKPTKWCRTSC